MRLRVVETETNIGVYCYDRNIIIPGNIIKDESVPTKIFIIPHLKSPKKRLILNL